MAPKPAPNEYAPRCARCRNRHDPALPCWTSVAAEVTASVLATYGTVCVHFGRFPQCPGPDVPATTTEHVRPLALWGNHSLANTRPAHLSCNQRRGLSPMAGWTNLPTTSQRW